jgi:uncharacterized protein
MRILAFADVPNGGFVLPDEQPDLVLLLGDIFYRNVLRIDRKYQCPKVGVLGNHDKAHFFDDTDVINVHRKIVKVNGLTIAGFEGSPKYNNKPFGQHLEIEAEQFVANIYRKKIDIFLAHSNPVYPHTDQDSHRGFQAFNDLFDYGTVRYFFHGHIHEPFETTINQTRVFSVYPYLSLDI